VRPSERREQRTAGFTLIEVLAAVAILGVSYTVLSRQGIEGLIWEGEADRLLRASLVADRFLADLETAQQLGAAPPVGHLEQEIDEFQVVVDVVPFEPPPGLLPEPGLARAPAGGAQAAAPGALLAPRNGEASFLRTIELAVRWHDGRAERSLRRTTFVLDVAAVAPLLAAAGLGGEPPPPGGPPPSPPGEEPAP
jgi:prepilin-type N-terminal cleavage/methylation domain-containing protein